MPFTSIFCRSHSCINQHKLKGNDFFWRGACYTAFRILVPRPGIEPVPPGVKVRSPKHWTSREFLGMIVVSTLNCFAWSHMRYLCKNLDFSILEDVRIFDHVSSGPWLPDRLKVRPTRSVCGRQPGDVRDPRPKSPAWLPAPGTRAGKQGGLQTSSSSPYAPHPKMGTCLIALQAHSPCQSAVCNLPWAQLLDSACSAPRRLGEPLLCQLCDQVPPLPSL